MHLAWNVGDFSRVSFLDFLSALGYCRAGRDHGIQYVTVASVSRPKVAVSNRVNNEKRKVNVQEGHKLVRNPTQYTVK